MHDLVIQSFTICHIHDYVYHFMYILVDPQSFQVNVLITEFNFPQHYGQHKTTSSLYTLLRYSS